MEWLNALPDEAYKAIAIPAVTMVIYLLYELRALYNRFIDYVQNDKLQLQDRMTKALGAENNTLKELAEFMAMLDAKRNGK